MKLPARRSSFCGGSGRRKLGQGKCAPAVEFDGFEALITAHFDIVDISGVVGKKRLRNQGILDPSPVAGATLASASWDQTVRLWPLAGGVPRVLDGHTQNVNGVAVTQSNFGGSIKNAKPGEPLTMDVLRDGKIVSLHGETGYRWKVTKLALTPDNQLTPPALRIRAGLFAPAGGR